MGVTRHNRPALGQAEACAGSSGSAAEYRIRIPADSNRAPAVEEADAAAGGQVVVGVLTGAVGVVELDADMIALAEHRQVEHRAGTEGVAGGVGRMTGGGRCTVVTRRHVMNGAADAGRAPGLVDAQVSHDV